MARLTVIDLNKLKPSKTPSGKGAFDWDKQDRGVTSGKTTTHFGDIATPLEQFLAGSEAIVGCVAWITSQRLVDALAGVPVALIVNKEFELRTSDAKPEPSRQRANLDRLTGGLKRSSFPAPLNQVSGAPDEAIDPVRCVGHVTRGRGTNSPLMHHKFVVRLTGGKPTAVWTGSFNFTHNAETSLENAVEIHDPAIARAYLAEWARVAALSEPLDFVAGKADPSWKAPKARKATPARSVARPAKRRAHGKEQVVNVADRAKKPAAKRKTAAKPTRARATPRRSSRSSNGRAAA